MNQLSANELQEVARDIHNELKQLSQLNLEIKTTQQLSQQQPHLNQVFCESLALKLHNFYTGCERIFKIIASELNGGLPSDYNWHQRLLSRMANSQNNRPAIISQDTAKQLKDYLSFRHVVRNVYGFELDRNRVNELVNHYYLVWENFNREVNEFINWLHQLAEELEER